MGQGKTQCSWGAYEPLALHTKDLAKTLFPLFDLIFFEGPPSQTHVCKDCTSN